MRLRLIVPSLFDFQDLAPLPRSLYGLRRAERHDGLADWQEAHLCRLFGLDHVPAAALSLLADGGPSGGELLRGDLCHLAVQQNSMSVIAGDTLQLDGRESDALAGSIEPLLDEYGLRLIRPRAQRWYLELSRPTSTRFLPLPLALGQALPQHTMEGSDSGPWKRLQAEIQMSLHQHPVNEAREQRGLPAINHLWLWGEGGIGTLQAPQATLWGDDLLLLGLATHSGKALAPLPSTFARWRKQAPEGEHIAVLDTLRPAAWSGDVAAWSEQVQTLSADWLQPALSAGFEQLILDVPGSGQGCSYSLGRWSPYRFWKNTRVGY